MRQVFSLLLAILMGMTNCGVPAGSAASPKPSSGGQSSPGGAGPALMALSEPVYPEFPQKPQAPEEGGEGAWTAYRDAYGKYTDALTALRGETPGLTGAEQGAVNAFAAKSIPLVLAGHEGENAIYSPLSLWSALTMLAQCAEGESRRQVLDALNTDSVDNLQETVSHIWRTLYTDDGQSSLLLANSIWLNGNLQGTYVQDTLDTLARNYFAGVYSVPMGADAADSAVTNWVSKQTNGLIGSGSPVVQTMPETLALLVSSLYYKAAWQSGFSAGLTGEDIFTNASGQEVKTDFMHKTQNANFQRRDGYQAAQLSTHLGEMVFVLPDEGVTPESLLQDKDFLAGLDFNGEAAIWGEVQWSVPKFDVNSDLNLRAALASMGVTDLLDRDMADLTALTDLDAFLSDAKQLARVKVDEEGVEAAAVTIFDIAMTSMPVQPTDICIMDLDRPFLFVIRTQDVPLFVGIVNQIQA